jgi:hypothetical protein
MSMHIYFLRTALQFWQVRQNLSTNFGNSANDVRIVRADDFCEGRKGSTAPVWLGETIIGSELFRSYGWKDGRTDGRTYGLTSQY